MTRVQNTIAKKLLVYIFNQLRNYADRPVLKNLDGMNIKYPKWIKKQIEKIATHLITRPDVSPIPVIQTAIEDLDYGRFEPADMQFTEQLDKDPNL